MWTDPIPLWKASGIQPKTISGTNKRIQQNVKRQTNPWCMRLLCTILPERYRWDDDEFLASLEDTEEPGRLAYVWNLAYPFLRVWKNWWGLHTLSWGYGGIVRLSYPSSKGMEEQLVKCYCIPLVIFFFQTFLYSRAFRIRCKLRSGSPLSPAAKDTTTF